MYEAIISGGLLVDGCGGPPRRADVAIESGRVAAVEDAGALAGVACEERVEADGLVVAPGFIDVHTHYDFCLGWSGLSEHCLKQGVTAVIGGNCGLGPADPAAALREAESRRLAIRFGLLAPYGPIRDRFVPRAEGRPARADETAEIGRALRSALEDGALGLSWGPYHANELADETELEAAARVAAGCARPFVVHRRCEGRNVLEATREVLGIARRTGCALHISHLKVAGAAWWDRFETLIGELEAAREDISLGFDVYPYDGSLTYLSAMIPGRWKADGGLAGRLSDQALRGEIRSGIEGWFRDRQGPEDVLVFARHMPELKPGGSLAAATRALGLGDPAEAALKIIGRDPETTGGWAAYRNMMSAGQVAAIRSHDLALIASDAVPEVFGMAETSHPRAWGTFARALREALDGGEGHLGRELVRVTRGPAERFGLTGLGRLTAGAAADLVLIDPAALQDRASYETPARYPDGIIEVRVAGRRVLRDGAVTEAPGPGPGVLRAA